MTVDELKQVGYQLIEEFSEPEGELTSSVKKILWERLSFEEWAEHYEV